jgi:hypothetical protein
MANTTGKKFGGRKKGTPNKLSATVKDNVIEVFAEIGGIEHMKQWALDNPNNFYNIYAKLLPTEIEAEVAHSGEILNKIERVVVDPKA